MSISCWRSLGSPSPNILKEFGHTFHPHGIISTFPIYLGGKIVSVVVEVVDATIDYRLILGRPWFYEMKADSS